nr:hypothetical protein GCM10020092_026620 [Actinoplanes digitatis]
MSQVARWSARITGSRLFEVSIVVAIGANAIVLGLETYPHLGEARPLLHGLELFFRALFVVEIAIRILAYGRRPQDFFRNGWNVFDFVVTMAVFVPGLHGDSTILRVVRIARVLRLVRFSPACAPSSRRCCAACPASAAPSRSRWSPSTCTGWPVG